MPLNQITKPICNWIKIFAGSVLIIFQIIKILDTRDNYEMLFNQNPSLLNRSININMDCCDNGNLTDSRALSTGIRIHWLYPLQRSKIPPTKNTEGHKTASDSEALVLESIEYPFIAINPRFTLSQSGGTCYGSIYRLNSCLKLLVLERTVHKKKKKKKKTLRNNYTNFVNIQEGNKYSYTYKITKYL